MIWSARFALPAVILVALAAASVGVVYGAGVLGSNGNQSGHIVQTEGLAGDVNCSGDTNPVDALTILRNDGGLSLNLPDGCPHPDDRVAKLPVFTENGSWYIADDGLLWALTEVYNGLDVPVGPIFAGFNVYDSQHALIDVFQFSPGCRPELMPGETGVVWAFFSQQTTAAMDRVSWGIADYLAPSEIPIPGHDLQVEITDAFSQGGEYRAEGKVTNTGGDTITDVGVCVAFYDAEGRVIRAGVENADDQTLGPSESSTFQVSVEDSPDIVSEKGWANGN